MKAVNGARGLVFLLALAFATEAFAQTAQPEPPRRPQRPAAGPVIKLPPGTGAAEERAQTAAAAKEEAAAPLKWEYCFISGFRTRQKSFGIGSSVQVVVAHVRYLPEGAEEFEGATEEEALGNALFKLGEEGWELAAVRTDLRIDDGSGRTNSVYFFKRPKRQE